MIDKIEISNLYKSYGFVEKSSDIDGVSVFTIRSGHFHNADIVVLNSNSDSEQVFEQFKNSGYACTFRTYNSVNEAELSLFDGFFSVSSGRNRYEKEYDNFTKSLVEQFSNTATYSYINVDYVVNNDLGESTVIKEITSKINNNKPILFIIEAAAGFGKTCTSYELLKELVVNNDNKIPLFSELSRNRQAKIFKYVLLDEIDRSFPQLSSSLVTSEIRKGNVPVILDGFDELLHRSQDKEGYENAEPMLETIGELLVGKAKVILTTRRTAIFDGDGFHEWMNAHEDDFDIVRIRLKEPQVDNWLSKNGISLLNEKNFPVAKLSNPVLLSYLRCIDDGEYSSVLENIDSLVDKYFESMLERERVRQDLRMRPKDQHIILKSLAEDMIEYNYTAENRDYILSCIVENNTALIEDTINNYPRDQKPTINELANKLASHALLDRKQDTEQGVGFVNEFVLGHYCSECVLDDECDEWTGDQRFIEPCVLSYVPRSKAKRIMLWKSLKFSMEFEKPECKVQYSIMLTDELLIDLIGETLSDISVFDIKLGYKNEIHNTIFIDCAFKNVSLIMKNMKEVTFVNCKFYDCLPEYNLRNDTVYFVNCIDDGGLKKVIENDALRADIEENDDEKCEIYVLEKFWPKGREAFYKHRPIKLICSLNNYFKSHEIMLAIARLKAKGILRVPDKVSFVEINTEVVNEIKDLLGR